MKLNLLKGCIVGSLLAASSLANAALITETQTETFTEYGERNDEQVGYEWVFESLALSIEEISLTFKWERMDFYDALKPKDGEYFEIYAEGSDDLIGTLGEMGVSESTECTTTPGGLKPDGKTPESTWYSDCDGTVSYTLTNMDWWDTGSLTLENRLFDYTLVSGLGYDSDVGSQGHFGETIEGVYIEPGFVSATISYQYEAQADIQDVPEPSSLAILALGVMGLAARRLNKKA